ncbi:alpha/beta fold hydrolase [Brachybacterium sp. FME24]|uniref:alpha/beta fold hydrolase n=1 Tax=Brachybacterium sp. FME24 TaxID=2742605 RepID=UPI0018662629|nr:alpha/beta hydrolase [Brachybacterium sp. FME24]
MLATTHYLDLPDQRIAYLDVGQSHSPPLVLLHGGAVDKRMWHPQLDAFPDHRLIVPDARGHGESSDAQAPYRLGDDVVALLDALEIERAVLVGVSMGGGTACDVALEHPDRAAAIVVSGAGTSEPEFTDPWTVQAFADWRAAEQAGDLEAWLEVFRRFTVGPERRFEQVDPDVRELIATMGRDTVTGHVRMTSDGTPIPPHPVTPVTHTWERLGQLEIPVLALCGALDATDLRANGRRLAATVPDGRYVEVPGSAHYPNLENPGAFDREVQDVLSAAG